MLNILKIIYFKEQLAASKELANRYEKELSGERLYRKELEARLTQFGLDMDSKVISYTKMRDGLKERIDLLMEKQENDLKDLQISFKMVANKVSEFEQSLKAQQKKYFSLLLFLILDTIPFYV